MDISIRLFLFIRFLNIIFVIGGIFLLAGEETYRIYKQKLIDILATSTEKGLSSREVIKRQRKYDLNKLPHKSRKGIISIFFDQFRDFMIIVLIAATILSLLMGEVTDSITISAIIILNAIMGIIQEYRAEKSLVALKKLTAPKAKVIRDNKITKVNAEELVPGDIIFLEVGNKVPADARILEAQSLQTEESVLTGESIPVSKIEKKLYAKDLPPGSQINMLFMGTTITRGKAKAVVTTTGLETEMGKIANLLGENNRKLTPLQKRLKHLGKWLVIISILITILIVVIGVLKGQSIYQMFLAGVSLAVAAIPEGLPAIVTLALAFGVQKMIKKNAIVRRLPAVETLGCATVICSDKTGTLTQNKMILDQIFINHKFIDVNSNIEIGKIKKILRIGGLCNSVQLKEQEKQGPFVKVKEMFVGNKPPEFLGDPTDIALVRALYDFDLSYTKLQNKFEVLAEKAFDSRSKRMSVLVQDLEQNKELWIKGAPEVILELSSYIEIGGEVRKLTPDLKREIYRANNRMAEGALRVLALAYRSIKGRRVKKDNIGKYENELILVGLTGLIDPPRPEVYEAVKDCKRAGIRPVMITGDHQVTAKVIAKELGIISGLNKVVVGNELQTLTDEKLQKEVKTTNVFARVSPADKLRIVKALKLKGEIVAMTGDGVNDAPALKEADIGVAMGEKGTDVAREVSSLILADDNFATIVVAVREGRKIYNNIRKFIRYLLSCNTGEILSIFMGIVMDLPLPLLPIQILWVNLVTDGLPALALGMGNDNDPVMNKPPRDPDESVFARGMISKILSQGVLIGISTMFAFLLGLFKLNMGINGARTMAFSTLVFSQLFFVFSCRSESKSFWQLSLLNNLYLLGAVFISTVMQLLVINHPYFNNIFQTSYLSLHQWLIVLFLSIWSTIFLEIINKISSEPTKP